MTRQCKDAGDAKEGWARGYILTVSTLLLFSVIVMFARDAAVVKQDMKGSYHDAVQVSRLNYLISDVSSDLRSLVSMDYEAQNVSANEYLVSITDRSSINKTLFLASYAPFLQGYGNITGANISLSYSDPLVLLFSNGMQYRSSLDGSVVVLRNATGNTSVPDYSISISADEDYVNYTIWNWTANGTFVRIHYADTQPPDTLDISGYVNSSAVNVFTVNYASGSISVTVGPIDGVGNSVRIDQAPPSHLSELQINATMPDPLPAHFNSSLNISLLNSAYSSLVPG